MAQDETTEPSATSGSGSGSTPATRLNAAAPEFTPRSAAQHHGNNHPHRRGAQHHHHHYHHHGQHYQPRYKPGGDDEGDAAAARADGAAGHAPRVLPDDVARRVVKQVPLFPFCRARSVSAAIPPLISAYREQWLV
jgi:La-related protein 7